jgi:hypothetical protein
VGDGDQVREYQTGVRRLRASDRRWGHRIGANVWTASDRHGRDGRPTSALPPIARVAAVDELDGARIASAIGFTRFPYSSSTDETEDLDEEGTLLRAADLIGQLGDPHYLRKANALYYEFEEIGLNKQLGYESPADIVDKYSQFYWNRVSPHIQAAIGYLNVTSSGRRWIAGLYSNVFRAERELRHSGPQP